MRKFIKSPYKTARVEGTNIHVYIFTAEFHMGRILYTTGMKKHIADSRYFANELTDFCD